MKAAALYKRMEAVGITPLKVGKHSFLTGTQLQVAGFVFTRAGKVIGRQIAWKVSKGGGS